MNPQFTTEGLKIQNSIPIYTNSTSGIALKYLQICKLKVGEYGCNYTFAGTCLFFHPTFFYFSGVVEYSVTRNVISNTSNAITKEGYDPTYIAAMRIY